MDQPGRSVAKGLGAVSQMLIVALLVACFAGGAFLWTQARSAPAQESADKKPAKAERREQAVVLTPAQLATVTIEPVARLDFRDEIVTEGKIAVDEDRTTPIFSPYSGRIMKLFAKPGMQIKVGEPLFTIEATDMVQASNDLIAAASGVNKAKSQLQLAQIVEKRQRDLFEAKAIALKELQTAQNELTAAQNDLKTAEIALEAARNRVRILGRTDQEIATFLAKGTINPETPIPSPIAGTIVQRKIGPGQYVSAGSSEPAVTVGDLSLVWVVANVRESDAPKVTVGQPIEFRILAYPDLTFTGRLNFVAASVDPATRRVQVRADADNKGGLLKPEMFASVTLIVKDGKPSPGVPRQAVVHEGDMAHVWVVRDDNSVELRRITTGLVSDQALQVLGGLQPGERIVTKGALFIDRLASGEGS